MPAADLLNIPIAVSDDMLVKGLNRFDESALFATRSIARGDIIFTHEQWTEDESRGWILLNVSEAIALPPDQREIFLRYSYDVDFGLIMGTFESEKAHHLSNFMNHSCDPNTMFGPADSIIARKDIRPGDEITIDYGNFVVNVDQTFLCECGSSRCRGRIYRNDWKVLVDEYGFNFPRFMHREIRRYLRSREISSSLATRELRLAE